MTLNCQDRPMCFELQPGKQAIDLIVDFLSCLWEYAKQRITQEIGAVADLGECTRGVLN